MPSINKKMLPVYTLNVGGTEYLLSDEEVNDFRKQLLPSMPYYDWRISALMGEQVAAIKKLRELTGCGLRDAKVLLERYGWIQGDMENKHGFCALGALTSALCSNRMSNPSIDIYNHPARFSLHKALDNRSVIAWNDYPGRTKEEVLGLFDLTIASLEVKKE